MKQLEKYLYQSVSCTFDGNAQAYGFISEINVDENYFILYRYGEDDDTFKVWSCPDICSLSKLIFFHIKDDIRIHKFSYELISGTLFDSVEELFRAIELKGFW
jgi:hypothetical protein